VRAIADHPLAGVGSPILPEEYTIEGNNSDVHPLLRIALNGGIIAVGLALFLPIS